MWANLGFSTFAKEYKLSDGNLKSFQQRDIFTSQTPISCTLLEKQVENYFQDSRPDLKNLEKSIKTESRAERLGSDLNHCSVSSQ